MLKGRAKSPFFRLLIIRRVILMGDPSFYYVGGSGLGTCSKKGFPGRPGGFPLTLKYIYLILGFLLYRLLYFLVLGERVYPVFQLKQHKRAVL